MRAWAVLLLLLTACERVPLRKHDAQFGLLRSHHFANEKTQYLFFRISGLRPGQARVSWPSAIEISSPSSLKIPGLKPGADGFANLDLSQGVHRHQLVECGQGNLCGSFSFRAEKPVLNLALRFRYHKDGAMYETAPVTTSVHPEGATADAQSALVYGVFNGNNSRLQYMVHDNFGDPDSGDIANFGMTRSFAIENVQLTDLSKAEKASIQTTGSAFMFPAQPCQSHMQQGVAGKASAHRFSGSASWSNAVFDTTTNMGSVCFTAKNLDARGEVLSQAPGMARRNPELHAEGLRVRSPMQEALTIPLVITYCPNLPESAALTEPEFLIYQRHILSAPRSGVDVCFAVNEEERFAIDLDRVLRQKLAAARSNNPKADDFFFKVIVHHKLAPEVRRFHDIIGDKLGALIASEVLHVSPRLVGSFIYDSRSVDTRGTQRNASIVWCPRREQDGPGSDASANCTPSASGELQLGPVTFLIPMGPFPTVDTYMDYVRKYGDRGQSKNGQFVVRSVRTNANSLTDSADGRLYTFFDGQRLSLNANERLKFCRDRDGESLLDALAFRYSPPSGGADQILKVDQAQTLMSGSVEAASVNVGVWWESPFLGGFSFDTPASGKVFSRIPISRTFRSSEKLGDERWSKEGFDLTPMLQKCTRYCDHPYFDEAGVYQIRDSWTAVGRCPSPKYQEPQ
jgi:hypothetical protein